MDTIPHTPETLAAVAWIAGAHLTGLDWYSVSLTLASGARVDVGRDASGHMAVYMHAAPNTPETAGEWGPWRDLPGGTHRTRTASQPGVTITEIRPIPSPLDAT